MWLYLVALVGLWTLLRFFRVRQVVSHLQDKYVFITGCDSGFGNLLARQLDRRGMRVLAACLTEKGAEELRNKTSEQAGDSDPGCHQDREYCDSHSVGEGACWEQRYH